MRYYSFEVAANSGHAAFHDTVSLLSWPINNHHTLTKSRFCSNGCGCWWSCSGSQGICRHSLGQIQVLYVQLNYPTGAGRWRVSDLCYHWFMVNDNSLDFSIWLTDFYDTHVCVCVRAPVCVAGVSTIAQRASNTENILIWWRHHCNFVFSKSSPCMIWISTWT